MLGDGRAIVIGEHISKNNQSHKGIKAITKAIFHA